MSARQELAQRIADFIRTSSLTTPYGGDVIKTGNRYTILFSYPETLDGMVNVYGPKFIQVKFQTAYRSLPRTGNFVFESESDALDFLRLAFVKHRFDDALGVPTKRQAA